MTSTNTRFYNARTKRPCITNAKRFERGNMPRPAVGNNKSDITEIALLVGNRAIVRRSGNGFIVARLST